MTHISGKNGVIDIRVEATENRNKHFSEKYRPITDLQIAGIKL
jgi:hypothetical protein